MKCPHCLKEIDDHLITHEAAKIMGKRSKRKLTTEEARAMAEKSHLARRRKKETNQL